MAKPGSGAVGGAQQPPQVAPCPPGRNMAGREPFAPVLSALRRCYAEAVPLETFVRQLGDSGPGDAQVLRAGDIPGYRTFVGQCLVCVPRGARAIPRPFTFQQLSSQSEVTTRVVQRLCEKGMKNVLAYGYSLPDENSSQLTAMPLSKIHNYLPNTATETLRISGFWETLLSRIGDDVMMYLLEHCAIFMLVPPSNCYQVCGQPIYELISCNVDSSLAFVKQRSSKHKPTSLLKYMRNRLMFHRNNILRSYGWKCRQRREDNVSRMRNERNRRRSLVPSAQCSAKTVSEARKQMFTERREKQSRVTECQEKQSSSNSRVTAAAPARSRKRKIHREQPEIPAKRARIGEKVREENACSLTPDVNQSSSSSAAAPARSWKRKVHREQRKIPAKRARIGEKVREENACSLTPDVNQSSSSSCVTAAAPSRTRKIHREQRKIPAKRARIGEKVRKGNACSLTPDVNQSSSSSAAAPARSWKRKVHREQRKIPAKRARIGEKVRKENACSLTPDVNQSSSSSCVTAAAPSRKRKIHREQPKIPAKRARIGEKVREENTCNLTPGVNQSSSERSETGCGAPHSEGLIKTPSIPQRSDSAVSGPSSGRKSRGRKRFVLRKRFLRQRARRKKPVESSTEMQAESHRKRVDVRTSESQLASVQTRPMEGISSQCRRQESAQPNLSKKLPDKLMGSTVYIERKYLLYSRRSFRECFPKSFVLNRLQDCQAGGKRLVQTIFAIQKRVKQTPKQNQRKSKWRKDVLPKRYWQMKHVFQELLENHGKCRYSVLLRRNCPVLISEIDMRKIKQFCQAPLPGEAKVAKQAEQCGKEPTECVTSSRCESGPTNVPDNVGAPLAEPVHGESQSEEQNPKEACDSALKLLLKQHSSHWQVYMFVRECLEKVIPAELWGSNHNKCRFLKNVKVFISRGKFAKMSLQELMWRMRVNDCLWLRLGKGDYFVPADEHRLREEILAKFLYWLMDTYVVELLRSFFYITETMFQKNTLFYYRKFVWGKLHDIGIRNHFVKVQLQPLSSEEIESFSKKKFVPVASKLRFIPKRNGLRPIVKVSGIVESKQQTLSKKSRENKMNHYNTQLKNLFSVLNYERTVNTSFIGSSVFGKDDIYKTWKQFVTKVLKSGGEIPHFYCVKADVSKAYDTIPHNKLVEVISRVLKPEKRTVYCIRRYAVIMITPSGQARKLYKRHVSTFKDFMPDMKQFVSHLKDKVSLQNAIVVEQSLTFNETSSSLFNFFLQMIHNCVLEIENRYYLQCCGIPQGSILSTLLCSLFYGDMENKLLSGIQQDGVLIRLIDDFLLLTPDLMKAKTFLRTLATGIPEYGLLINPDKTVVNFPVDDIPGCSKFKQLPDCRLIPWCGLLLDIKTLEVYGDYSSYARTSIRSSLSFNSSRTAGKNMKHKLSAVLKLKCHGLFLDLQINSLRTVLINIYKIFLLQAYRFHACVLQLPFNQQVRKNPRFFLKIISQTTTCCYAILKTINAEIVDGNKHVSSILPIQAVEWLCYHAFTVKLSNHRFIYKCLLSPLKVCEMQLIRKVPVDIAALLKAVTDPSVYQDFKTIQD